jgi:tetratricopeptide (TPR) repeat protein
MTTYRNRARTLSWLLVLALFLGAAEDGFADKKKDGKKKKKNKDQEETSESVEPSPAKQPPKVVKDVETRLLAYDTATARTLLTNASSDPSVYLKVADGRVSEQEANYTKAISLLTAASSEASSDPAPLVYLGEAYLRTANTAAASDAFARAEQRARAILASSPSDPAALYSLGVSQQRQKRYDEAIATLEKARADSPRDALVLYQLGATRAFKRDWPSAIDTLTQAIDLNPGIAYAYYYRGLAAGEAGRKDLLVNDLDRFLAMAPNAPEAEQARRLLGGL